MWLLCSRGKKRNSQNLIGKFLRFFFISLSLYFFKIIIYIFYHIPFDNNETNPLWILTRLLIKKTIRTVTLKSVSSQQNCFNAFFLLTLFLWLLHMFCCKRLNEKYFARVSKSKKKWTNPILFNILFISLFFLARTVTHKWRDT